MNILYLKNDFIREIVIVTSSSILQLPFTVRASPASPPLVLSEAGQSQTSQ